MRITSKAEFFARWSAGALGFRLRTWTSAADAVRSGVVSVGFREVGRAGGGVFIVVPCSEIMNTARAWDVAGRRYQICETAPDDRCTLQGEVCRTIRGLEGLLGLSHGLRMRDAMAAGYLTPRSPGATFALLDAYMSPASRDDLDALLELYPDATVEFSCYGDTDFDRGRNTIFWEVRDY